MTMKVPLHHASDKIVMGIDIGSISVNIALLNQKGKIIYGSYTRHHGQPASLAVARFLPNRT